MKEVILQVEDAAYETVVGMLSLCPAVKVISSANNNFSVDECIAAAISELQDNSVIRYPRDFAYIMHVLNEGLIKDVECSYTPIQFMQYLDVLHVGDYKRPSKSTLYNAECIICNKYPDWTFTDKPYRGEAMRRIDVGRRFIKAYGKKKLEKLDAFMEKI